MEAECEQAPPAEGDEEIESPVSAQTAVSEKGAFNREDFECPLCHELLCEPCVPSCGHAFCRRCLADLIRHSVTDPGRGGAKCPVCRRVLHVTRAEHLQVCRLFDQLLAGAFAEEHAQRKRSLPAPDLSPSAHSGVTERLPVFILDATLPRQHLQLNVFELRYITMVRRALQSGSRCFGMSWSESATRGVEVEIIQASEQPDGRYHVEVVGRRPFKILSSSHAPEGFLEATIEHFDMEAGAEEESESCSQAAEGLLDLLDRWEKAVSEGGWLRFPGHLALVKEHLGPTPGTDRPGTLAAWAVALANPLPALGVAPEMRPDLLNANEPLERVKVAEECLKASLAYLNSVNNSVLMKAMRLVPRRLRAYLPMLFVAALAISVSKLFSVTN
eukprot:TRINITY_DN64700_c0_g1_i1.p1 TRINITY_DN64700_c0_g1~~TRINITY_DN64700_c0_g1_i1.p1  ORF type:complete len:402 (+),score=60.99 TRINITY_DN64700_c0_g1_i1:44-1207(+)